MDGAAKLLQHGRVRRDVHRRTMDGTPMEVSGMKRRRKRTAWQVSRRSFGREEPVPFAAAEAAVGAAVAQRAASRSVRAGVALPVVNLAVVAGIRLSARDFSGAAECLPVLLKRYRRYGHHRWYFTREVLTCGTEVLRRAASAGNADRLDDFLALVARDGVTALRSWKGEGHTTKTRDIALLERAVELVAAGKLWVALDYLKDEALLPHYKNSALVHGYLGMLAVAASAEEREAGELLRVASSALDTAAKLDPDAYFYVYYAAAAAIAAGNLPSALDVLRVFVASHDEDPLALFGLLSCLDGLQSNAASVRQEKVTTARRLLAIDVMASSALNILREAWSWSWDVEPRPSLVELANVYAMRIEHGGGADEKAWSALSKMLPDMSKAQHRAFWDASGRGAWWPSHYFRPARVNSDIATAPSLAAKKASVANMLMGNNQYTCGAQSVRVALL